MGILNILSVYHRTEICKGKFQSEVFTYGESEGKKQATAREVAPYGADVKSIAEGN